MSSTMIMWKDGIAKAPDMQGLAPEQIAELGLKDETHKYYPSGGDQDGADEIGVRTGRAPTSQMQEVLTRTAAEAKAMISKVGAGGGRACPG